MGQFSIQLNWYSILNGRCETPHSSQYGTVLRRRHTATPDEMRRTGIEQSWKYLYVADEDRVAAEK